MILSTLLTIEEKQLSKDVVKCVKESGSSYVEFIGSNRIIVSLKDLSYLSTGYKILNELLDKIHLIIGNHSVNEITIIIELDGSEDDTICGMKINYY